MSQSITNAMSPSKYIQETCKNAKQWFTKSNPESRYPSKHSPPFSTKYRPECDISPELEAEEASYFQSILGVLRWTVELGRIDITAEVSMLSSHLVLPREGYLAQAFHIFTYLEPRHASRLVFGPTYPLIDESLFNTECDSGKPFYGDVKEPIPGNAPEPRGKPVVLRVFLDSDHAGDKITRHSRTGYIIYMNGAPVDWFSKKQNTIES
jgi:hypothetical protein